MQREPQDSVLSATRLFARPRRTLIALALLLVAIGRFVFAAEAPVTPEAVPVTPSPPPSQHEQILSPVPPQFDWMHREVRPNPLLEGLLALREQPGKLLMSVSLTEEYSDNFFLDERNREDEYRTAVSIGTVYRREDGRSFLSLANTISADYAARSELSNVGFANLSLNTGYRLPRLSLSLSESFIRSDNVEEVSPAVIRAIRRTVLSNSVSPQVRYDLSPITALNLAYANRIVRNEHTEQPATDTLAQGGGVSANSISHAFTAGLQHRFTRTLSSNVGYSYSIVDSEGFGDTQSQTASADLTYLLSAKTSTFLQTFGTITDRSAGEPDSRIYGASIGMRRQLTSFLTAFVAIGPSVLEREGRGTRVFPNWQANLDGALPLTRRTTLTFSTGQSIRNTAGEVDDVGIVLSQSANLTLSHLLSRNLQTSLFAGYTRTELLENIRTPESIQGDKVNFWTGGAGASYALTRLLSLGLNYRYQHRDSDVPSTNIDQNRFGTNFNENRVTVSLTAAFPVF
jgi:opacity protein-like surface antigen